uniref:FLYWCH-type domain-containing protein n=1 Tax=Ditylenchus dipsaci TaxID=166011 RepID=A0A915DDW6_9BILA
MRTLVLCDGYEMRHDKSNTLQTIQYWRCLKKLCNGRAKSEFGGTSNLEPTKAHNCRKSSSKIELRQQIAKMKMDALSSYRKPTIDVI